MARDKFREQQISQMDMGGVLKNVHDFDGESLRVRDTVSTVQDYFTHFEAVYDVNDQPTQATYLLGTQPHVTTVGALSDSAGSLNSTYFLLFDARSEQQYHVWYNVSGGGVNPAPANSIGIEVAITTNDVASIVSLATTGAINITAPRSFAAVSKANVVCVTTVKFGDTDDSVDVSTGFLFTNQQGSESVVQVVDITYSSGNPIWEGQELKGYNYNIFDGKFEQDSNVKVSNEIDLQNPDVLGILNKSIANKNVEVTQILPDDTKRFRIQVRDNKAKLQIAYGTGETVTLYKTISRGSEWESGDIDIPNGTTLYILSSQDSIVVEIEVWTRA